MAPRLVGRRGMKSNGTRKCLVLTYSAAFPASRPSLTSLLLVTCKWPIAPPSWNACSLQSFTQIWAIKVVIWRLRSVPEKERLV